MVKLIWKFLKNNLFLFLVLTFAASVLTNNLDKPFWGHHDFNNSFFGNIARNYVRYGLIATKLGQANSVGFASSGGFSYHTHHPPLLPLSLALSYWILGISEFSTRIVPVIFSALTVALFFIWIREKINLKTALVASLFWLISPLYLYFGKMAIHEVLVLFFFVFSFWQYTLWTSKGIKLNLYLMITGILLGMLSGWPGYYTPFVIALADLVTYRRLRKEMLIIILAAPLMFFLYLGNNMFLTGSIFGGGFAEAFRFRSGSVVLNKWAVRELQMCLIYFNRPVVVLAFLGLVYAFLKKEWLIVLLFFFGLLHPVLFKEASFRHDYLIYYWLPFFALGAALTVVTLVRSKALLVVTVCLVAGISLFQSFPYLKALLDGDRYKESVYIGRLVNTSSAPSDRVLIVIPENFQSELEGWHVSFYADRDYQILRENEVNPKSSEGYSVTVNYSLK